MSSVGSRRLFHRSVGSGFTLIELLVVVIIMSILVSAAMLAIPDMGAVAFEREAKRLHARIRYAEDTSMQLNMDIVLVLDKSSMPYRYFFQEYDYTSHGWMTSDDPALRPEAFSEFVDFTLLYKAPVLQTESPAGQMGRILLPSTGLRPIYELHLFRNDDTHSEFTIRSGTPDGTILVSSS